MYDKVSDQPIISVHKMDESESGHMVMKKNDRRNYGGTYAPTKGKNENKEEKERKREKKREREKKPVRKTRAQSDLPVRRKIPKTTQKYCFSEK